MKIFLDTADHWAIEDYYNTGLIDGVTTNPTLIRQAGRDPEDVYEHIKGIGIKDISMEVVGDFDIMYSEGYRLFEKFGDVATIKVPCTREGLMVCKALSDENIRVNVTLVFSTAQAVLAAKSGATYVSPFVGRLDDQSVSGLDVMRDISDMYRIHGIKTQVLSASIRSVDRAVRSWYNGAQIVTMPPKVFDQMYEHILTEKGLEIFDKDWQQVSANGTK